MLRPLAAFLAALFFAGCTGPLVRNAPDPTAPADFPNHTAAQIAYRVAEATSGVSSYRSEARVEIASPDFSQGVSASLRARVADSVYATLRGPLSITVGRGLVTADSILAYDGLNRKLYLGVLTTADAYLPGAGTPGALGRSLLGLLVPDATVPWTIATEGTTYVLTGPEPGAGALQQRYVVDPALWRVTALDEFYPDGALATRRTFSAFDQLDGRVMPRRAVLTAPADGVTITIEHRQLTLNPDDLGLRWRRPEDAEIVRLE